MPQAQAAISIFMAPLADCWHAISETVKKGLLMFQRGASENVSYLIWVGGVMLLCQRRNSEYKRPAIEKRRITSCFFSTVDCIYCHKLSTARETAHFQWEWWVEWFCNFALMCKHLYWFFCRIFQDFVPMHLQDSASLCNTSQFFLSFWWRWTPPQWQLPTEQVKIQPISAIPEAVR